MTTTNEELREKLDHLLETMAAEKKAAKEKEAAEAWVKPAAVSLVLLAVLSATAVQRSGSYGSRSLKHLNAAIFQQVKASDEWAFFQATSTKANLYEEGAEEVRALAPTPEQGKALAEMESRGRKHRLEQESITTEAKRFEGLRDAQMTAAEDNAAAGGRLGLAVIGYQLSVAIASICLVIKKKPLWYVALAIGAIATVVLAQAILNGPAS